MESLVDKRMYSQNPYNSKKKTWGFVANILQCVPFFIAWTYLPREAING